MTNLVSVEPQEAREWLAANPSSHCFATNRFEHKAEARELVDNLYTAGASLVQVDGIDTSAAIITGMGGPHADTLRITTPNDRGLHVLVAGELGRANEQFILLETPQSGQSTIVLWWD